MIRSFEIKQDLLTPVPDGDYRTYDVNYVYGNNAKIISDLKNQYDFDLDEVLARDDEVVCDYVFQSSGKKFLAISFLLPELNKGLHLDNLVTPIALLIFKGKLIIVTAHRIAFISQLLTQFQLQDSSNFVAETVRSNYLDKHCFISTNILKHSQFEVRAVTKLKDGSLCIP